MANTQIRLGVDIGGTFTDVVLEAPSGLTSAKVLTTYAAPEDAIIDGIQQVAGKAGVSLSDIGQIIHGTTLATNALIERRGAKTALITTQGFRDVIEMRTESRFEQYDLNLKLPEPLLQRSHRYTIDERIGARGEILKPIDKGAVQRLARKLKASGYESIAVGFLHSYVNDQHESLVGKILAAELPEAMVSLSCDVSPQMREYERFNTTIANAYIKPLMKSYLSRLKGRLNLIGVSCPIFLMHSGGGVISIESASEFPVRLVESGPAGGAVFAADIAKRHGINKVLSFDMGGTTAKICLIKDYTPKTARVFEVARSYRFKKGSGMPISIPVIDMVEIGAGGGSLAHVDIMNQIRVGPESAGSEPGPACYDRGGNRPAVTDADLVLGKLDASNFAGGSIKLSLANAETALSGELGNKLDMDTQTSAFGLAEVVDENMANAARVHAVENGEDLSEYTMIAFGGAAPLHAARLCEKLGINRCLVPQGAGVGSAIGFLRAPFSFEANRSVFMSMSNFDAEAIAKLFREMEEEAKGFVRNCAPGEEINTDYKLFMRYKGQGWEIPVELTQKDAASPNLKTIQSRFEEEYQMLFGRTVDGMDIEVTVWSVNAFTKPPELPSVPEALSEGAAISEITRDLFDAALGSTQSASVVNRRDMAPGKTAVGPAVVTEDETTIVIPSSRNAMALGDGTISVDRKGDKS